MQLHQGMRLKKYVELSHLKVKDISEKSGVATSSLHDMYKKEELLWSKIEPILNVLGVSRADFYKEKEPMPQYMVNESNAIYGVNEIVKALQGENKALRDQITTLQEMVELLKRKK